MRVKLSPTTISRLKPRSTPFEVPDADVPGLLLRVQPSGVKSFIVSWGRARRKTIGRVGKHTVEQMKVKARKILLDAEEHGEPRIATRRSTTLGDFFREHYKPYAETTHKDHVGNLKAIETEFAHLFDKPLAAVSAFDFEKYRSAKLQSGIKPVTVNRHFDRIRAVFTRAVEWKVIEVHPLQGLKRSKVDRMGMVRFLSDSEEAALRKTLAARDQRMRAERVNANKWRKQRGYALLPSIPVNGFGDMLTPMVLLSMNTGMRRGELLKICWSDVDLKEKILTIRGGYAKSGQTRYIPLNIEALDILRRWQKSKFETDVIFPILRVDKSWKSVLKAAKIKRRFRWHDLRHHFASRLVQRGVDLNTVRELLGHADIAMTLRYSHLSSGDKASAVARLAT